MEYMAATAPPRASARRRWRSVGVAPRRRTASAVIAAVSAASSTTATGHAAAVPASGWTAHPHGPDHSAT